MSTEITLLDLLAEIKAGARAHTRVTSAAGGLTEVRKTGLKSEKEKKK